MTSRLPRTEERDMRPRACIPVATVCLTLLACSHQPEPTGIAGALADADRVVVVSPSEVTLDVGGTQQFSAQLIQGGVQRKAAFTWSSSDPGAATVSSAGLVTAVGGGDTTTLATVNTASATPDPQDAYGVTNMPSGDTVLVGTTNGPIIKLALQTGAVQGTLNLPVAAGYHFEWNKTRTRLYASQRAFDGGRVFEIEPNGFTLLRTFETGGSAQGIQLSADDSKLFVAAQDGGVIVWDVASNSLITR